MTNLNSPGVSVTLTDSSAYASSGTGTIPVIFMGTHEYKAAPDGSLAVGTHPSNANTLYYITSQRELLQTFGNPIFYSNNGTMLDGYELNEYGLHAAYQYLGVANTAYVLRGDIDYSQLIPTSAAPRGEPLDGTIWLDVGNTSYGVFQSNGNSTAGLAWDKQSVTVINKMADLEWVALASFGVADSSANLISKAGKLVIGTTEILIDANSSLDTVVRLINGQSATTGVVASLEYLGDKKRLVLKKNVDGGAFEFASSSDTSILSDLGLLVKTVDQKGNVVDSTKTIVPELFPESSQGLNGDYAVVTAISDNKLYKKVISVVSSDASSATKSGLWLEVTVGQTAVENGKTVTTIPSPWQEALGNCPSGTCNTVSMSPSFGIPDNSIAGDVWVQTNAVNNGLNVALKTYSASSSSWSPVSLTFYNGMSSLPTTAATNQIAGVYGITSSASWVLVIFDGSKWEALTYEAALDAPTTDPEEGTLWFNPQFQADIMVNVGGKEWKGYRNHPKLANTDPNGVTIAGSAPTTQSTGASLVDGDLWLDSSDTENYPALYRYTSSSKTWAKINNTDQVTPFGIVFSDVRQDDGTGSTASSSLTLSDFVDPDTVNPELYPDGTLLFNTRYSSYNIKQWKPSQFSNATIDYSHVGYKIGDKSFAPLTSVGRWVTVSGNNADGSPIMGRKAQRKIIVDAISKAISSNQDIRSENIYFSLIAAPGYCELLDEMVSLSQDKKNVAHVVGDTPARLAPDGTSIQAYANPTVASLGNTETSITGNSPYSSVYYPWGKGTNIDGNDVVIPPSTMMLRTIAESDNISYPWYPAAGFTRGIISNASTVGYIDSSTGKFKPVLLNNGQRDVLYTNQINPIAYMAGRGVVAYGQKTRQSTTTAMDRVNVSRLVSYLNYQLENIVKPFLFELNNDHTRQSVQITVSKFLADLMNKNAITDYLVVCDTSNNTPDRIDNNELFCDIAIVPDRAVEFIYVPLRIANTGADLGSFYTSNNNS